MFNYEETYSRMSDDELLRLASQWGTLTEPAQAALTAELEKRNLRSEFDTAHRMAAEKPTAQTTSPNVPSTAESVMFRLFVCSAVSALLFHTIGPQVFDLSGKIQRSLYGFVVGISDSFLLWLIIWLMLRTKRIQRRLQG